MSRKSLRDSLKDTRSEHRMGEVFNPFGLFYGVWVPQALLSYKLIGPGSKLLYARLARYAGKNGKCYPSQLALAKQLGFGERHIRNLLRELEDAKLIRRVRRGLKRTNRYEFLRHPILESCLRSPDRNVCSGQERMGGSGQERNHSSFKESHVKESQHKESHEALKYSRSVPSERHTTNPPSKLKCQLEEISSSEERKATPSNKKDSEPATPVQNALADAFGDLLGPPDGMISEKILAAGRGASAESVCSVILRYARKFRDGKKPAPRSYGFFVVYVGKYFEGHPPGEKSRRVLKRPRGQRPRPVADSDGVEYV
jgi:hypothetical protein